MHLGGQSPLKETQACHELLIKALTPKQIVSYFICKHLGLALYSCVLCLQVFLNPPPTHTYCGVFQQVGHGSN
jgi:hypothetical protein